MFLNIFLLVFALCLDTFVASAAYGTNQVHLSAGQIAVINGICSLCLGVSLMFGTLLDSWIPESFTRGICFISLMLLGFLKLADSSIKRYLRRHRQLNKNIRFSFSQLRFIINIYSDPLEADADESHDLTWKEVIFFFLRHVHRQPCRRDNGRIHESIRSDHRDYRFCDGRFVHLHGPAAGPEDQRTLPQRSFLDRWVPLYRSRYIEILTNPDNKKSNTRLK